MRLEDLRKLAEARTRGEWGQEALGEYDNRTLYINDGDPNYEKWPTICEDSEHVADVEFIAAFANHAEALLDVVEAAREMLGEMDTRQDIDMSSAEIREALAKLGAIK